MHIPSANPLHRGPFAGGSQTCSSEPGQLACIRWFPPAPEKLQLALGFIENIITTYN